MGISLDQLAKILKGEQAFSGNQLDLSNTNLDDDALEAFIKKHRDDVFDKLAFTHIDLSNNQFTSLQQLLPFLEKTVFLSELIEINLRNNPITEDEAKDFLTALFKLSGKDRVSKLKVIHLPDINLKDAVNFSKFVTKLTRHLNCDIFVGGRKIVKQSKIKIKNEDSSDEEKEPTSDNNSTQPSEKIDFARTGLSVNGDNNADDNTMFYQYSFWRSFQQFARFRFSEMHNLLGWTAEQFAGPINFSLFADNSYQKPREEKSSKQPDLNPSQQPDWILEQLFGPIEIELSPRSPRKPNNLIQDAKPLSRIALLRRFILRETPLSFWLEPFFMRQTYQAERDQWPLFEILFAPHPAPLLSDNEQNQLDYEVAKQAFIDEQLKGLTGNKDEIIKQLKKAFKPTETVSEFDGQVAFAEFLEQQKKTLDLNPFEEKYKRISLAQQKQQWAKHAATLKSEHVFYSINHAWQGFTDSVLLKSIAVMLLHDAIQFGLLSTRRYDMPWVNLLTGFYRQGWGLLGAYSGFPNQVLFWALSAGLITVPMIMTVLEIELQSRYLEYPDEIFRVLNAVYAERDTMSYFQQFLQTFHYSRYQQALKAAAFLARRNNHDEALAKRLANLMLKLAHHGPWWLRASALEAAAYVADVHITTSRQSSPDNNANNQSTQSSTPFYMRQALGRLSNHTTDIQEQLVDYQRWTLGQSVSTPQHVGFTGWRLLRQAILRYSHYRAVLALALTGLNAYEFFTAQAACRAEHRTWNTAPTGEYECTVCGDWPEVMPYDANSPQACLTGLLQSQRPWPQLFEGLERLSHFSNYTVADFSNWNFPGWNDTIAEQVFDALGQLAPENGLWEVVNVSVPTTAPLWPPGSRLMSLAGFLNEHPAAIVDISQLNMGAAAWTGFLNAWQWPENLAGIHVANGGIADQGFYGLGEWISNHSAMLQLTFRGIVVPGNAATDNGLQAVISALPRNASYDFDGSNNQFTGQSLVALATRLFRRLNISGNDLTGGDFSAFGQAVAQMRELIELILTNTQLDDPSLIALGQAWQGQNFTLQLFRAGTNPVTGRGVGLFGQLTVGNRIVWVDWSNTQINNLSLPYFLQVLPEMPWLGADFSLLPLDESGVSRLLSNLPRGLQAIYANGYHYGDAAYAPFAELPRNSSLRAIFADQSRMSNQLAGQIIEAACRAGVETLSFENSQLTGVFGFLANVTDFQEFHCINLLLRGNQLPEQDVMSLFAVLRHWGLQRMDIRDAQMTVRSLYELAVNLLGVLPNPRDLLAPHYPYAEARWVYRHTHALTQLVEVHVPQLIEEDERPLRRAADYLDDMAIEFDAKDEEGELLVPDYVKNPPSRFGSLFSFWEEQPELPVIAATGLNAELQQTPVYPAAQQSVTPAPLLTGQAAQTASNMPSSFMLGACVMVGGVIGVLVFKSMIPAAKSVFTAARLTFFSTTSVPVSPTVSPTISKETQIEINVEAPSRPLFQPH